MSSGSGRSRVSNKRKRSSEEPHSHPNKRRKKETPERDWDEWISATTTRNYLLNDPLIDWLSYHSDALVSKKPRFTSSVSKARLGRSPNNFNEFIMAQGKEFETKFIEYLYRTHAKDVIIDIGGDDNARSEEKVKETIDAMNRGIPFIHSGVLHNSDNKTYGVPDLLVRSDWIRELVGVCPIERVDERVSAPQLKDIHRPGKPPKYHYRVIDIKFTTLYLRADGIKLLNSGSIPAWKGQLLVYNQALARVQGYEPPHTYILGRKWTFTSKGETFRGSSCVDRLGVVDYVDTDQDFVERTRKALDWIRDMRKNGKKWNVLEVPLKRRELYPNMSNNHDYPWRQVKEMIATDIAEITDLWMCGVKNREAAHASKIYRWTDPRCTTEILGIKGPKIKQILDKIIFINRDAEDLISPAVIENDDEGWQTPQPVEFYVDFEYMNDVMSNSSNMPVVETSSIIFLIGVGYFDRFTHEWVHKSFVADSLSQEQELRICTEFSDYIRTESEWWECSNPLLVHWAPAEDWQWSGAVDRHDGVERAWIPTKNECQTDVDPRWFDLLKIFKKEPIVIKGALGFSLKEVAGALSEHRLIKSTWDQSISCTNGTSAMLSAFKASKDATARGLRLRDTPQMKDIVKYNEVDCRVVGEIIEYLREHHTG